MGDEQINMAEEEVNLQVKGNLQREGNAGINNKERVPDSGKEAAAGKDREGQRLGWFQRLRD